MNAPNPAPWTYENVEDRADKSAHGVVKDADGKILFDTLNADAAEIMREDDGEGNVAFYDLRAEANLTLAAAAPALLAACKNVREILALQPPPGLGDWNWPAMVADLDAAIALTGVK